MDKGGPLAVPVCDMPIDRIVTGVGLTAYKPVNCVGERERTYNKRWNLKLGSHGDKLDES